MDTVRVEFPLGEIQNLSPLIIIGMIPTPEIDAHGITGKEKWNAQGLEGKAYVNVKRAVADLIVNRLTRLRSRIV